MIIKHNLMAMNAQRNNGVTTRSKAKTTEKLSSGYRINRAADDAAGLAISEKMRRQIRGLTQASLNAQDGVSLVQIADGAMAEMHDMLHRGTELSVKAANGTLTDEDRRYIQSEITAIKNEIIAIREKTTFNEIPVLKGGDDVVMTYDFDVKGGLPAWVSNSDFGSGHFGNIKQIGATDYYPYSEIDFSAFDGSQAMKDDLIGNGFHTSCATCQTQYSYEFVTGEPSSEFTSGLHHIYKVNIDSVSSADDLVNAIINAGTSKPNNHFLSLLNDGSGKLTMYDNRGNTDPTNATLVSHRDNSTLARGVAVARKSTDGVFDVTLQIGSEVGHDMKIILPSVSLSDLSINGADVSTQTGAKRAIDSFKAGIAHVSEERSRMGAYQNRLEHTIKNLDNVVENTTAAESSIRDTDMANEMVRFSMLNILDQAGVSMMTQANQASSSVLSLLS